jgi:hypothetical protein
LLAKQAVKPAAGSLTQSATIAAISTYLRALAGTITPTGAIARAITYAKSLVSAVTPAGSLAKSAARFLAGTVTSAGAIARGQFRAFVGALTPSGNLLRSLSKSLAGAVTSAGSIARQVRKLAAGAFTPMGALQILGGLVLVLAGSVMPSGAVMRVTSKGLAALLALAGTTLKQAVKSLLGSSAPNGALLPVRTIVRLLSGVIAPAGSLAKLAYRLLSSTVAAAGVLLKSSARTLSGSITSAGAYAKAVAKSAACLLSVSGVMQVLSGLSLILSGTIIPTGAATRQASRFLSGAATLAGTTVRAAAKSMVSTVLPDGAITTLKIIFRALLGSITPSGSRARTVQKFIAGFAGLSGGLAKSVRRFFAGIISGVGAFVGHLVSGSTQQISVTVSESALTRATAAEAELVTVNAGCAAVMVVTINEAIGG